MKELRPVILEAPSALAEFLRWLGAQLGSFLRNEKPGPTRGTDASDFVLGRQYVTTSDAEIVAQETDQLDSALTEWRQSNRKTRYGIRLELARDAAILRSVAEGSIPLIRAWKMAKHDLVLNTPFDPAKVHLLFLKSSADTPGNRYLIVKRSILDGMIDVARRRKQRISELYFRDDDEFYVVRPEIVAQFNKRLSQNSLSNGRIIAMLAVAMFLVSGINFYLAVNSANAAISADIDDRDADIAGIRALLKKRDQELNAVKAAYAARKEYVPLSQVLETLTKAVPDGTYLTELTFRGKTLRISGYSDSAPKLISLLSHESILTDPKFVSPVIKVAERGLDQFTIELAVKTDG